MAYDYIKFHKIAGFYPLYAKHIFGKTTGGGSQIDLPSLFRVKRLPFYWTTKNYLAFIKKELLMSLRHLTFIDWLLFEGEQIWLVYILLSVSGLEIIWSRLATPEFFEQVCYDTLFGLVWNFHFTLLYQWLITLTRVTLAFNMVFKKYLENLTCGAFFAMLQAVRIQLQLNCAPPESLSQQF